MLIWSAYYSFNPINTMTNNELKNKLQAIIDNTYGDTLETEVAKEALEHDDIILFFDQLFRHGCVSGMVSSLVYYTDTRKFYDKHYHEIEILRSEFEEMGCPLKVGYDLKNDYAWFAFEVIAGRMADKLGLE